MALTIDKNLCPQNHTCPLVRLCPESAIAQQGYALHTINADKCIECGMCVWSCGKQAVG